eukprot:NODE_382_length_8372_cov_0.676538.p2 type:complete len:292 gc:universal NODE_382_length_8372_cov_0.676538:6848-7723(+)
MSDAFKYKSHKINHNFCNTLANMLKHIFIKCPLNQPYKFVDASWDMSKPLKSIQYYINGHLPNAVYFNIDQIATSSKYPHMLPSPTQFDRFMSNLGISNKDHLLIYDQIGVFSSCRVYWTFKVFGHEKVQILNGGLPHYASHYPITRQLPVIQKSNYQSNFQPHLVKSFKDIKANIRSQQSIVIDARSSGRFNGTENEPRAIPSGHIKHSINLPFSNLLNSDQSLKSMDDIRQIIENHGQLKHLKPSDALIMSCGSGVTASILFCVFSELGFTNLSVYDGSWTEYIQRINK